VFSQDESRFGLLTIRRRRLTASGVQPVGLIQHVFEWFYVYGAVAPTTGERFFLELPYLNAAAFQLFLNAFSQAFPDSLTILLLDNSGAHTAQRIRWPENVRCVWLPPYCPELNPVEDVPLGVVLRSSAPFGVGHVRFKQRPFMVREIGWVW
jgi:hypothetical protein